jgi:hypothetical protein
VKRALRRSPLHAAHRAGFLLKSLEHCLSGDVDAWGILYLVDALPREYAMQAKDKKPQ